jgi:hypothetical protein
MFERGKLVTSLLRAAALDAGAVILTPFCAFADSVAGELLRESRFCR